MLADVGDTPILPRYYRNDAGALFDPTTVTATLKAPDTTVTILTVAHPSLGTYVVAPYLTTAGDWLATVTAVGPADVYEVGIFAKPVGETAPWAPDLRKVGSHISSRTRSVSTNEPLGTFTADTNPNAEQVDSIISSAVAAVAGMVGKPIEAAAFPLCQIAAALWAAYWVELAFPERDADVSVYARLRDDALMLSEQARAVNLGAGGGTQDPPDEDGIPDALSMWSFDPAPAALIL